MLEEEGDEGDEVWRAENEGSEGHEGEVGGVGARSPRLLVKAMKAKSLVKAMKAKSGGVGARSPRVLVGTVQKALNMEPRFVASRAYYAARKAAQDAGDSDEEARRAGQAASQAVMLGVAVASTRAFQGCRGSALRSAGA